MYSGSTLNDCTVRPRALNAAIKPAVRIVFPTLLAVPAMTSLGVRTSSSILPRYRLLNKVPLPQSTCLTATVAQGQRCRKGVRQICPLDGGENQGRLRCSAEIAQMQAEPVEPVPPITLEGVDDVEATAGRKVRRGRPFVEGDSLRGSGPVAQVQTQVAAIRTKRLGPDDLGLTAEQQRLTISHAKRREHLDLVVKARLQIGESRGRLDPNGPRERIAIQPGCRIRLQTPL